jgi:hypothetical protein|tara:strand:+ start:182 stop:385 length:204 start_codon:yes stop_codon:yes gene_type:complete
MIDPDMKTLGLRQMHPMQVEALMDFVGTTIKLAAETGDNKTLLDVEASADELIKLFGGRGIRIEVED